MGQLEEQTLFESARAGKVDQVSAQISTGTSVDRYKNYLNQTALAIAAQHNRPHVVALLLRHGADVNTRSIYGDTPLIFAAAKGHVQVIQVLLSAGADANARNDEGTTSLTTAAFHGHTTVVQQLLQHGADKDISDQHPETGQATTALQYARQKHHHQIVALLLGSNQQPKL